MRYFRALTLSFILSGLVHGVAVLAFWLLANEPSGLSPMPRSLTVVELLESPELPKRPKQLARADAVFVRKAVAPPEVLTKEKRTKRFASEDEQTVLVEQQARASGMTTNRSTVLGEEKRTRHDRKMAKRPLDLRPQTTVQKMAEEELVGGLGDVRRPAQPKPVANSGQPLDFSRFGNLDRGMSTIGEKLPDDVRVGDFTALNTDRHLYYSFYSRMEEKIRGRWTNYVRSVVFGLKNGTEPLNSRPTWTTRLEIILDKDGTFERAIMHQSSGSRGLDSAPVQAFRDAQQFPHPPEEMIKAEDGKIHLDYAFTVDLIPRYAAARAPDEE